MLSVVVPTRNRPHHGAPFVEALLANPALDELVVVDQSDDSATRDALSVFEDPRLRYLRSDLRGELVGRNTGIAVAAGDLVASTDDDCRAAPDWAERLKDIFRADPSVAAVCGRVRVPEELSGRGFAIAFEPRRREWLGAYPAPDGGDWGIAANLTVRRQALEVVGGFDPLLGVGTPLMSGGEPDLLFRILRAGMKVVNASEVVVDHLGLRAEGAESRDLWRTYAIGTAAAVVKHVRAGDTQAIRLYLRWLWACAAWNTRSLWQGKRPTGVRYTLHFLAGSIRSFRFGVDRRRRMYAAR